MTPVDLVVRGEDRVVAIACSKCGTVWRLGARAQAEACCAPARCEGCGCDLPRGRYSRCEACQTIANERRAEDERRRAEAARARAHEVSLADYLAELGEDALVCLSQYGGEGDYREAVEVRDDGEREWAWACTRQGWPRPEADSVIDSMVVEEMYDGAADRLDRDALQAALDAWLDAQPDARAWMVDDTRVVLLAGGSPCPR